jgi:hypothetical protein
LIGRKQVPITIESHLYRRVTEVSLHRLWVSPGRDKQRRAGVAQIMHAKVLDSRTLERRLPAVCAERLSPQWPASGCSKNERFGISLDVMGDVFGETVPVKAWEDDGPSLVGLGRPEVEASPDLRE